MHKIGMQSTCAIRADHIDEDYKMLKDAGIDCVDFGFDEYLPCAWVYEDTIDDFLDRPMEEIRKDFEPHINAAKKYNLTFEQMHAPFPMMQKGRDAINEKMHRITVNCMELCAEMGGRYIVVHPINMAYSYTKQEEHDFNIAMYRKLIAPAKEFGVTVCLENLFLERNAHLMEGICSDVHEAVAMIDELNEIAGEEVFGFCFDVGHANILSKNIYQFIVALGDRLKILHIHDNDGISDLHTMPYTFARGWCDIGTEWEGFLRGLRDIKYQGVLNFETFRCMQAFPRELHPALLNLFVEMGRYFSKRIEEE